MPEILDKWLVVTIPLFTRFYTSQVVIWDSFHQQYFSSLQKNSGNDFWRIIEMKNSGLEPLGTLLSGHMVSQKWHQHVQALEMGRWDQAVSSRSRDPSLGNKNSDHGGSAINNDVRKLNFSQSLVDLP